MKADETKIIVTEIPCDLCGTKRSLIYHEAFPELRITGPSVEEAAQQLHARLTANLDAVVDPVRRESVQQAIADGERFLDKFIAPSKGSNHPAP
jgi:hypothetical protein